MEYKWKLSPGSLLDMWPKYGHLSNLAEIMKFRYSLLLGNIGNQKMAQLFSCLLDSQELDSVNIINIIF